MDKDIQVPSGNVTLQLGTVDPTNRMFFVSTKETMQWYGYDLDTGNLKWGPVGNTRSFNYYPTIGSGGVAQIGYVAYGKLYVGGYGGEIFAMTQKQATELWSYGGGGEGNSTNSGTETSWGLYPTFIACNMRRQSLRIQQRTLSKHATLQRRKNTCLNATTGQELWTLDSWAAVGGFGDFGFPTADGQIAYLNAYDMKVYSIGKGPSAMTVTHQKQRLNIGKSISYKRYSHRYLCRHTASTNNQHASLTVSQQSPTKAMGSWMEYVYMQKANPNKHCWCDCRTQCR